MPPPHKPQGFFWTAALEIANGLAADSAQYERLQMKAGLEGLDHYEHFALEVIRLAQALDTALESYDPP